MEKLEERFLIEFEIEAKQNAVLDTRYKTISYIGDLKDGPNLNAIITDKKTGENYDLEVYQCDDDNDTYETIVNFIKKEILEKE
jgi:hypothetical protein